MEFIDDKKRNGSKRLTTRLTNQSTKIDQY